MGSSMKKRAFRWLLFLLSMGTLLISMGLFWNMGIYIDIAGTTAADVCGGSLWLWLDWLRLLFLLVLTVMTGIQLWKEDKKWIIGAVVAAAALDAGYGILRWKSKRAVSVSIIGGADGPTAVFLAGRLPDRSFVYAVAAGIILLVLAGCLIWKMRQKRKAEDE